MRSIYEQASIHELTGLSYAAFQQDPRRALAQAGQDDAQEHIARGFRPLLPEQARIRARLDATWATGREEVQPRDRPRSNVVRLGSAGKRRSA